MATLPRWRTQQHIQAQSVAEHMVDTSANILREHLVTSALYDPALDSETMRDCVLHMYLNECKSDKDKQWYATTQKAFLRHHPQWKDGFDDILKSRWEHGLKSQRTNQMGDWIALSQLGGEPLSLDLLFREKLRHPRDPRPPTHCFPSIDRCSQRRRFYRGVCFRNACDAPLGARFVHQRRIGLDVHGPVPRTR